MLFRDLRHLNSLVAFEAAGRHGNFTLAAEELHVTRVAISRQIRTLEQDLGLPLFIRRHRGVALTPDGQALFDVTQSSLREIADTRRRIRRQNQQRKNHLSVTLTAAFATYWLIPRMGRFSKRYPEIDLRLLVSDSYMDLAEAGVDVAIRWGKVGGDGLKLKKLFPGAAVPVCSPAYLANSKPLNKPSDLLDQRLIQLEGSYRSDAKWPNWFERLGVGDGEPIDGVSVDSYTNMIQAALAGQGIALGDMPMLDDLIADGRLVYPLEIDPDPQDNFYLALPRGGRDLESSKQFCRWIRDEAAAMTH